MMNKINSEVVVKLAAVVVLAVMIIGAYLVKPDLFATIWYLATSGDINGTIEFLRSFGAWAIVISIVIDILINMVGFLPSIFISTANGIVFGLGAGIVISWFAETVGVIISFVLMRTVLRSSAEELIKKSNMLQKIDEFSGASGFKMMLFARTLPYFPSGIITALGAVSRISLKDYIMANFLGKFPSTALEVIVGYDVVNYQENLLRLTLVVLGVTFIYGLLWWYNKRKLAKGH
ncbi:TVP38/TMEM64 family protein [Sporomusa sp.]|uniref:TVP38/TMEM64 family protein n=1 Tax=Sporomusa sp. TaxID=2078658 RepID=UPI002CF4F98F|nr:VTT domain-containing protein [Sporomusa sp.]HWR42821.1 VTT domain-containing protein [Sporomusa sp.]